MSQELNNQMLALTGVDKLHALGYKGNGIKIMLLDENFAPDYHGTTVKKCALISAPNAQVDICVNTGTSWDKAIAEKYDIVNISMLGTNVTKLKEYVAQGGIVICATGNQEISDLVALDEVVDVGTVELNMTIPRSSFKSEWLDMVTFIPYIQGSEGNWFQPNGTSFSSPFLSGVVACLLEHWKHIGYKYTPQSVKEYLIKHAVDILAVGKDNQSGYGYVKVGLMNTIKATIGQNSLVVNGIVKPIPQGAVLVNGNTMVPFRAIGDAIESVVKDKTVLSYKTDWDATTKTAIYFIDTK